MNTPNKLTILRVLLIPVFVVVFLNEQIPYNEIIAAAIFIIASLTDFFDGYLARKYNLITNFGKFLDPLADKLLVNIALICFLTIPDNPVPAWVVMIIISRDFIISGFRLVASDNGIVIAADYWGKVKTTVQMVMTILVIIDFDTPVMNIIENIFIYAALVLTVISLIVCMTNNKDVLKDKKQGGTVVHSAQYGMSTQFASMNEHQISIAVHSILGGLASQTVRTTVTSELLAPALAYIHGHFADDISLDDLAGMCGISKSHFIRSFKRYVGCTPHEYLLQYRLRQSKRLLLSSDLTVEQIAEDCGFNSASHFARAFRQETDISPTAFRAISF